MNSHPTANQIAAAIFESGSWKIWRHCLIPAKKAQIIATKRVSTDQKYVQKNCLTHWGHFKKRLAWVDWVLLEKSNFEIPCIEIPQQHTIPILVS